MAVTTVILTSGTSWAVPSGVFLLTSVTCTGGGGAGGKGVYFHHAGGGGGGGESAEETSITVTPAQSVTFAIGAAGVYTGGGPNPGGTTTCTIGSLVITAHGGGEGNGVTAGTGGTGSTNTTHVNGAAGQAGSGGGSLGGAPGIPDTASPPDGTGGDGNTGANNWSSGDPGLAGSVVITYGSASTTDTDTFGGVDAGSVTSVTQTIIATDNPAVPVADAPGKQVTSAADPANPGSDSPVLTTATLPGTDASQLSQDVAGNQVTSDTDQYQAVAVEIPLPGPVSADLSQPGADAPVSYSGTLSTADAFQLTQDIAPTPGSVVIDSDQYQAAAVEASNVLTTLKTDTDAFNLSVDAGSATSTTLVDADAVSAFDIGVRFPVTDTDTASGTDGVSAAGSIITDTDAFAASVDTGFFNVVHLDSDASNAGDDESVLIVTDTDSIFCQDTGLPFSGTLSDRDAWTGAEVGFINFSGEERVAKVVSTTWMTRQRVPKTAALGWVTRNRYGRTASVGWGLIDRRDNAVTTWFRTLERETALPDPVLVKWSTFHTVSKTATVKWNVRQRPTILARTGWNTRWRCKLGPLGTTAWNVLPYLATRVFKPAVLTEWRTPQRKSKTATVKWDTLKNPTRVHGYRTPVQWNTCEHVYTYRLVHFETLKHVTGTVHSTKWNVRHRVTTTPALLGWDTLGLPIPVTVTCPVRFNTLNSASALKQTTWDTLAGTPVSQVATVKWETRARPAASRVLSWETRARTSTHVGTLWWNTLQPQVTPVIVLKWNVRQPVVKAATVKWNERQRTGRTVSLRWVTLTEGRVTALAEWRVSVNRLNEAGTVKWNTRYRAAKTATITWTTQAATPHELTGWNVYRRITKTGTVKWNVRYPISQAATVKWDTLVLLPVSKTILTKWATRVKASPVSTSTRWNVRRRTGRPATLLEWRIRTRPTTTPVLLKWNDRLSVRRSAGVEWNVLPRPHQTALVGWGLIRRPASVYLVEWHTLESVTVATTLEWDMATKVQGLIMNAPAAPWQSSYPSR